MKALKFFLKPFEVPQRSVKIIFKLIFLIVLQLSKMYRDIDWSWCSGEWIIENS